VAIVETCKARELSAKHDLEKQQEDDDKKTEMANMLYGDFLTENPAVAQSAFGPHRVVPDRWKGMTPEQIAEIRRVQELQRAEAQVRFSESCSVAVVMYCYINGYSNFFRKSSS
jgi:hypothetical protein